jgi:nucleotide-binding universal stress UspA family protein
MAQIPTPNPSRRQPSSRPKEVYVIYPIRSIVAGVATIDELDPAVPTAIDLAIRTGARLHLIHALELPPLVWGAYAEMGVVNQEALDTFSTALRLRLESRIKVFTEIENVECEVLAGPPAQVLAAAARAHEADLLVVGATRFGRLGRAILGTTVQRVLREASVPVLVARGLLPERGARVLLSTDLTNLSAGVHETALDVVESLFRGDSHEVRSLHVVDQRVDLPLPLQPGLLDEMARNELQGFIRERRQRPYPVVGVLRYGDPSRAIIAEAEDWDADLLVLGTHSRVGAKRWFFGSVAEACLRGATRTALVIPAHVKEQRTLPVTWMDAHPIEQMIG